ncbi:MAG: zinc ribbon domain-containing protein [Planctomycetota bacterium]
MPTYDYVCSSCRHQFSVKQLMSDAALETCPSCGGSVERVISGGAGLFLKKSSAGSAPMPCGLDRPCCRGGGLGDAPCDLPPCSAR